MEEYHAESCIQNYKNWKGNNRFYCKGRLMTGPPGDEMYAVAAGHFLWWLGFMSMNLSIVPYVMWQVDSVLFKIS